MDPGDRKPRGDLCDAISATLLAFKQVCEDELRRREAENHREYQERVRVSRTGPRTVHETYAEEEDFAVANSTPAITLPALGNDTHALRKRRSDTGFGQDSPCSDAPQRHKSKTTATAKDVIVINDDEKEEAQAGLENNAPSLNTQNPHRLTHSSPVDHLGHPLSEAALAISRQYWDCQRKLDSCLLDEKDAGAALPFELLLDLALLRRCYTRELFGLPKLEPGTRTYEPPYIDPLPPALPPVAGPINATTPAELPPGAQAPQPRSEPVLCPEQLEVVELAASGRNIFYTGSAGCGKSTVLHAIKKRLKDMGRSVRVMAPTGKVAMAINGTTTWTFAGWTPDHHKRRLDLLKKAARGKTVRKRFVQTDTIIVDEISMVENLHFERLDAVMRAGRANDAPFGDVQVIVTGDFCQLPPVKPFQYCIDCGFDLVSSAEEEDTLYQCPGCWRAYRDSDKWAFRSKAWAECKFINIYLKSIHRQSDHQFISILQKYRLDDPFTQEEVDILMTHRSVTANAVKLFSTREEVKRTNDEAFA
jgi:ATP-dependent DNA helicase PIF1